MIPSFQQKLNHSMRFSFFFFFIILVYELNFTHSFFIHSNNKQVPTNSRSHIMSSSKRIICHTSKNSDSDNDDDDDDDGDDDGGELLLSWVEDHEEGFVGPLEIRTSTVGYGRGLFVSDYVNAGDVICEIPCDNCLSMEQVWEDDDLISLDVDDEDWIVMLSAKVSKEYLYQKESYWFPYLRELNWKSDPSQHFLWWNDEDVIKIKKQHDQEAYDTAIQWRKQVNDICQYVSDHMNTMDVPSQRVDMDELKHIVRASLINIYSRAFHDEPHEYQKLIPILDMMQHTSKEESINVDHETDFDTGNVIVTALRDLKRGEELCFQYGITSSNDDDEINFRHEKQKGTNDNKMKASLFFFMYGFLPPS